MHTKVLTLQKLPSGKARKQMRDPLNPQKRISITGDPAKVLHKAKGIGDLRDDLRNGAIASGEARAKLARQVHGVVTVAEAWRVYQRTTLSSSWRKQACAVWKHRLAPSFEKLACAEVTELVMREWQSREEKKGLAPATIANAVNLLRAMLSLMVRDKRLEAIPWGEYRPPKVKGREKEKREAFRSIDELALIVREARRWDEETRSKGRYADLAFRVLVKGLTGLRQGELAALGWDDLELDGEIPIIHVRHQARDGWQKEHPEWTRPLDEVKGRSAEAQRLHESAVVALRYQRENLDSHGFYRANGPVFPGKGGKWRTHADAIDAEDFKLVCARAGVQHAGKWVPHSLRHGFATTEAIALGGDIKATMGRMRHKDVETTMGYIHAGGRGLPASRVPALPADAMPHAPPRLLPPHVPEVVPELAAFEVHNEAARAMRDIVTVTAEESAKAEAAWTARRKEKRNASRRKYFKRNVADYSTEWDNWNGKGERPPAVTNAAEDARQRARNAHLRERPGDLEQANKAGQRSFRATLASWARFVKGKGGRKVAA